MTDNIKIDERNIELTNSQNFFKTETTKIKFIQKCYALYFVYFLIAFVFVTVFKEAKVHKKSQNPLFLIIASTIFVLTLLSLSFAISIARRYLINYLVLFINILSFSYIIINIIKKFDIKF